VGEGVFASLLRLVRHYCRAYAGQTLIGALTQEEGGNRLTGKAVTRSGRARNLSCLGVRASWGRGGLGIRPVVSNAKGTGTDARRRGAGARARATSRRVLRSGVSQLGLLLSDWV
jgi:hypothetical protein